MKHLVRWLALLALPISFYSTPAASAVDLYLDLDGIPGESQARGHEKWIDLLSYQFGVVGPSGNSPASFSEMTFTKLVDASTPKLFLATVSGQPISDAVLDVVKPGTPSNAPFLKYSMSDVLVSRYSVSSSGDTPTEVFSLSFAKLTMAFFPQKADGTLGDPIISVWNFNAAPVPEPSAWVLFAAGLGLLAVGGRRLRNREAAG